jgi:acetolactate decarboxylase
MDNFLAARSQMGVSIAFHIILRRRLRMPTLTCQISQSLQALLDKRSQETGESVSHIVSTALARCLDLPQHTLFQISTAGALVHGVYEKAVSSNYLLNYGDFGLGTFVNLDGEMVILDGAIYQVRSNGRVLHIEDEVGTPFAVVVRFHPDQDRLIESAASLAEITKLCDRHRNSNNIFYAIRIDGRFAHVHTRAMRATLDGLPLAKAAAIQPEFDFQDVSGTLVGIWAPQFSSALNVVGYHFHFLSEDRMHGGHLLECSGEQLRIRIEALTDFYLSLPESEEFLKADLTGDISNDLAYAEQIHKKGDA